MKKALFLTSALLLSAPAFAYYNPGTPEIKPYIGINIGYSGLEYGDDVVSGSIVDEIGGDFAQFDFNFGLKFGDFVGAEIFAAISSPSEYEINGILDEEKYTMDYTGYGAKLTAYAPINENFDLFASAGVGWYNFELESELNGSTVDDKEKETGFIIGVGAMYNFNENFGMSAMYEYVGIGDDIFDYMSQFKIGARYTF